MPDQGAISSGAVLLLNCIAVLTHTGAVLWRDSPASKPAIHISPASGWLTVPIMLHVCSSVATSAVGGLSPSQVVECAQRAETRPALLAAPIDALTYYTLNETHSEMPALIVHTVRGHGDIMNKNTLYAAAYTQCIGYTWHGCRLQQQCNTALCTNARWSPHALAFKSGRLEHPVSDRSTELWQCLCSATGC